MSKVWKYTMRRWTMIANPSVYITGEYTRGYTLHMTAYGTTRPFDKLGVAKFYAERIFRERGNTQEGV